MDIPKVKLKDRLTEAIALKEITPKILADRTGIPKSSISQYMSGYAHPKQDRILSIAEVLDVNPTWLLGYDVPIKSVKEVDRNIFVSNLNLMMIIAMEALGPYEYKHLKISKERLEELQLGNDEPTMNELENISKAVDIPKDKLLTVDLTSPEGKPILDKWLIDKKEMELLDVDILLEDAGKIHAKKEIISQILRQLGLFKIDCLKDIYDYVSEKSIENKNLDDTPLLYEYVIYEDDNSFPVKKKTYNQLLENLDKKSQALLEIKELNSKVMENLKSIIDSTKQ